MYKKILGFFLFLVFTASFGQKCDCEKNLHFTQNHIEKNYPGFPDKVNSKTLKSYQKIKNNTLENSRKITVLEDCISVIYEYISYFRDGHIQIFGKNGPIPNTSLYPNHDQLKHDYTPYSIEFKQLTNKTVYLRFGSFFPGFYQQIDSIVQNNRTQLKSAENIIVDIRGNEGGATFTYNPILPYLGLDSIHFIGFDVLATDDNIKSYEEQLNSPYIPDNQKQYIRRNIHTMKQNKGKLTSLGDDYTQLVSKIDDKDRKVAILIDNDCGSTAEHFLFAAKQSKYVTLLGEPTIGMYDYGDMREFSLPNTSIKLWCATNRSRRLNVEKGIDNIGIQPDIPLNRNKNWIKEALFFLEN